MGARIFAYYFIGSFATACLLLLAIAVGSGDGRTYVVTSDVSGPESKYQFGQHLRVLYQPEHPDGARIDAFAPLWTLPLVAGIIGSAFSVVPAIVITGWRRRRLAAESQVLGTCMGVMLAASGVQVGRWVTPGSRTHWALGALVVNSNGNHFRMGGSIWAGIRIQRGCRQWRCRRGHGRRRPGCAHCLWCFLRLRECGLIVELEAGPASEDVRTRALGAERQR